MLRLFASLHGYQRPWLRRDLVAGLTVWAVLIPEALAYATIAGVSPVVGLYAAPGALILYAALGSSRSLVTGPMAAPAALSAATVADRRPRRRQPVRRLQRRPGPHHRTRGAARRPAAARVPGQLQQRARAQRLHRRPRPHNRRRQLPKLLGISKGSGNFFEQAWHVITHLGDTKGL